MSIRFLLDEKPAVVPVGSGGERSGGMAGAISQVKKKVRVPFSPPRLMGDPGLGLEQKAGPQSYL